MSDAVGAEIASDAAVNDLLASANAAADVANAAIENAEQASETLAANANPTSADVATAQNAIDSADAAIATAADSASAYESAAAAAGETLADTTLVGSTDAAQTTLSDAVGAEIASDAAIEDMISDLSQLTIAANNAADTANAAADSSATVTAAADANPTPENLATAQAAQSAADTAASAATNAANSLQSAIDSLNATANAAGETVDTTVAQNAATNANEASQNATDVGMVVNDRISNVSDSDATANSVSENVADGTYSGVTLSAVDVDGDAITYSVADGVPFAVNENGEVVTNGAIDFEATTSYTFDVTATSADGTSSTQSVTIDVNDIVENLAPETTNGAITMNEDAAHVFSSSDFGMFSDADGDVIAAVKIESAPDTGTITLNGVAIVANTEISIADINNGNLIFTPDHDSDADTSFNFQVSDGVSWSDTATTSINVASVADTPVNVSLDVSRDDTNIVIDSDVNIIENGDTTSLSTTEGVAYSMSFNYSGNEVVGVYLGDALVGTVDGSTTSDATHTLNIAGVGAPADLTFKDADGNPFSAVSDAFMSPAETMIEYSVDVSASLSDTDGSESLSIVLSGLPDGATLPVGQAGLEAGTWVIETDGTSIDFNDIKMYIPESSDTFELTATAIATDTDGNERVSVTDMVVDVELNTAATSTDDAVAGVEDTTLVLGVNDFGSYSDENGDAFSGVKITELPENGTLRLLGQDLEAGQDNAVTVGAEISLADVALGNLVFVPEANFSGDAAFGFRVSDGSSWSDATYHNTMSVAAVADAPIVTLEIGTPQMIAGSSTPISVSESFDSGWSGNSLSTSSSTEYGVTTSSMNIDGGQTATKTFTGLEPNAEVTVSFELTNESSWDISFYRGFFGGSSDTFNVFVNDGSTAVFSHAGEYNNTVTFTATTDAYGEIKVNLDANSSKSKESATITDFVLTGSAGSEAQIVYPVDIVASLGADLSETLLDLTLTGIPTDATLYANGVEVSVLNGEAALTQDQLSAGNITMTLPESATQEFNLSASVASVDGTDSIASSASVTYAPVDSVPEATNEVVNIAVEAPALENTASQIDTNVVLTLDLSGSMGWDGDAQTSGVQERLELAKDAIRDMLNSYDGMGDVSVKLTTFASSGSSSAWMSATDAMGVIEGLQASGRTNYEDAVYETYTNFGTPPAADRTIGFFISDGEPTVENNEGRDASGNTGTDAQSGWLDSSYKDAWTSFAENNLDELNIVGIGTGITNTTYLDMLGEADNGLVKVNVFVVEDVTQLSEYLTPKVEVASGNIMDNVDFGADGAGGLSAITIDGQSYSADTFPADGLNAANGKLVLDFDTGEYTYTVVGTNGLQDYSETFVVTAVDKDGDAVDFNLTMNVSVGENTNVTGDASSSINTTDGSDNVTIDGDITSGANVSTNAGDDTVTLGGTIDGGSTLDLGVGDDTANLTSNSVNLGGIIDGGEGFDALSFSDDISIDFSGLADNISNIESVDLGAGAQNITSLSIADVLEMTDTDNTLRIDGDSSDHISLNTNTDGSGEWTLGDFKTDAETGVTYQEATGIEGDSTITLEISTEIHIDQN